MKAAADLDYRIVVPSRGRPENMDRVQALLPTATIVVDEAEEDRYLVEVDRARLVTHPGAAGKVEGLPRVFNWILDHFTEDCIIEADDDLQHVDAWHGSGGRRVWNKVTHPEDILQILENGVRVATDLDVGAFGWGKSKNEAFSKCDHTPYSFTGLVANVFGVRGSARKRYYDPRMIGRASVDWTLRTLLEDRIVLVDNRIFFDCGTIFGGKGGNSGMVTTKMFEEASRNLKETWGRHVRFGANKGAATRNKRVYADGSVASQNKGARQAGIHVSRRSPGAQK